MLRERAALPKRDDAPPGSPCREGAGQHLRHRPPGLAIAGGSSCQDSTTLGATGQAVCLGLSTVPAYITKQKRNNEHE